MQMQMHGKPIDRFRFDSTSIHKTFRAAIVAASPLLLLLEREPSNVGKRAYLGPGSNK